MPGEHEHTLNVWTAGLSASLDRAVVRLNESHKREMARALDLPRSKRAMLLVEQPASLWNHVSKRAILVIATAIISHSLLDSYREEWRLRCL